MAGLLVIGALTGGMAAGVELWHPWTHCGAGVEHVGDQRECVGVTDGQYVFSPELGSIERAIRAENDRVRGDGGPYVSIAYLERMTPGDQPAEGIRRELEGAYLAQMAANYADIVGKTPAIRLLLANDGPQDAQWRPVVDELSRLAASEHLVAVAGLGPPSEATAGEVDAFHRMGIPVIAAALASGDLVGKGLVSLSPTVAAQIDAAVAFETSNPTIRGRGTLIVQDVNPADTYASQLAAGFGRAWDARSPVRSSVSIYRSDLTDVNGFFASLAKGAELCRVQIPAGVPITPAALPPLIYFAGRGLDLAAFVRALTAGCFPPDGNPYQIITGPDAINAPIDDIYRAALGKTVTVAYTGWVAPEAPSAQSQPHDYFVQQFGKRFGGDPSGDERAIMAHDVVWVAVNAARGVQQSQSAVTAGSVQQFLGLLQGSRAVTGVAGRIELDNCGDRVNEVVGVKQAQATSTSPSTVPGSERVAAASQCRVGS